MNLAAFAVIVAREREPALRRRHRRVRRASARTRPLLAWPLTIAMLGLAGIPATAGFIGKFYLIDALVDGDYTWLGVVIVIGSMISLGYYLRVVAAMWMRDAPGARAPAAVARRAACRRSPAARRRPTRSRRPPPRPQLEVLLVAWVAAIATVVLGIVPQPLFELAADAGRALTGIF